MIKFVTTNSDYIYISIFVAVPLVPLTPLTPHV